MERYKELAALRCFTHDDMVQLAGSESSAVWQIKSYLQKDISSVCAAIYMRSSAWKPDRRSRTATR